MQAVFLRHEGYLGALGALMSYGDPRGENLTLEESKEVSSYKKYPICVYHFPGTLKKTSLNIMLYTRKMLVCTIRN